MIVPALQLRWLGTNVDLLSACDSMPTLFVGRDRGALRYRRVALKRPHFAALRRKTVETARKVIFNPVVKNRSRRKTGADKQHVHRFSVPQRSNSVGRKGKACWIAALTGVWIIYKAHKASSPGEPSS